MDYLPYEAVYLLCFINVVLMIYSFVDNENKFYGNIFTSFLSFVISILLSIYFVNGRIMTILSGSWVDWESVTLSILCLIIGIVMFCYTVLNIIIVFLEKTERKERSK